MTQSLRDIDIASYDYPLPDERIAKHPLAERDSCKLLLSPSDGEYRMQLFSDLPGLLPEHTLLVANNARVINARIIFEKATGSKIEIFLLEPHEPADYALAFQAEGKAVWKCLVGNLKRWKDAPLLKVLSIDGQEATLEAHKAGQTDNGEVLVEFRWAPASVAWADIVKAAGYIPIPPYLNRASEKTDEQDYQTVYSAVQGSVAAPTAGLHFTPALFERLARKGIDTQYLTLHVGAGTFRPVKAATIGGHEMHSESFSVSRNLLKQLIECKRSGRPVTAVGTTSVRTLESLPYFGRMAAEGKTPEFLSQWEAYDIPLGDTQTASLLQSLVDYLDAHGLDDFTAQTAIMIAPGFEWRMVDAMVTNFHQPQSTLLLLVASFLEQGEGNPGRWRDLYDYALQADCRFLSYGDACLLFPMGNHKHLNF